MKIFSGIIMLIGAFFTLMDFIGADTAIQQAASVVYVVGAYVTGRALENFMPESSHEVVVKTETITKTPETKSTSILIMEEQPKSIKLPNEYTQVEVKHIYGKPETVTRKQYENLINKYGVHSYIVLGYK